MNYSPYSARYDVPVAAAPVAPNGAPLAASPRLDEAPELLPVQSPPPPIRSVAAPTALAIVSGVAAVVLVALCFTFPTNSAGEVMATVGNAVALFAASATGVILAVVFGLRRRSRTREVRRYEAFVAANPGVREIPRPVAKRPWLLTVWGAALAAGSLFFWIVGAAFPAIIEVASLRQLSQVTLSGVLWGFSGVWLTGAAISAGAWRSDTPVAVRRVAVAGLVIGLSFIVPAIVFAALFSAGVTV